MIVIIPHTENLSAIKKYQNALLDFANRDVLNYIPVHPLWFPLPETFPFISKPTEDTTSVNKDVLKKIAGTIRKFSITTFNDESDENYKNKRTLLKIDISTFDGKAYKDFSFTTPLIVPYKKNAALPVDFSGFDGNFSKMNVRIFRIAESITLSPKTTALSAFVWKKLDSIS